MTWFAQDFATFARVSGYVEQFDIHSPQATVKEALWFSARLRLTNDISNKELWTFIRQARPLNRMLWLMRLAYWVVQCVLDMSNNRTKRFDAGH